MIVPRLPEGFEPDKWNWYDPRPYDSRLKDDRDIVSRLGDTDTVCFIRDDMAYTAYRKHS